MKDCRRAFGTRGIDSSKKSTLPYVKHMPNLVVCTSTRELEQSSNLAPEINRSICDEQRECIEYLFPTRDGIAKR